MPLPFPQELIKLKYEIRDIAVCYGLDFYEVIFELLDYDDMNMVASYTGFPSRYPHWRFGMEYEHIRKSYSYGLSKIYEMVINNDPCYAYLLSSNAMTDHKIVMAHVYGHCDFFKNNYWFSETNRKMVDEMANHGTKIAEYMDTHGVEEVENFFDSCLSIENLIDPYSVFIERHSRGARTGKSPGRQRVTKFRAKDYMESFINPKEFIEEQEKALQEKVQKQIHFPSEPERDILLFLIENAPLPPWKRNILSMIREEAYYFAPQRQTKIMNEGWATYWHSTMMTRDLCLDSEIIDYADHHSGTLGSRPGVINPYKIGVELFRDIEDRWNKGKFGKKFEECDDIEERRNWDLGLGKGREKIFEVRRIHNDITFIDEFLNQEFCDDQKFFVYGYDPNSGRYVIVDRDYRKVKQKLLFRLTNAGEPFIAVVDGNYKNRGELLLKHDYMGVELKLDHAQDTLRHLFSIWTRPVNIDTYVGKKHTILTFDGEKHSQEVITDKKEEKSKT
jgi:stage V sporulation protein R